MKKNLFLFILGLLLISMWSMAQSRIVEHPQYESTNTGSLEINKLELKNSETVLYFDGFEQPNRWIYLSSKSYLKGKSGKIYKFLHSEGFDMDKQIFMPASGTVSFKLLMEPLDKKETSFDFIEGENSDQFRIMGVEIFKNKLKDAPIHCIIKGEVIDRPESKRLILIKTGEDARISAKYITIRNGKFEYKLDCKDLQAYDLIFYDEHQQGMMRPVTFFAEPGTVYLKLYPMSRYKENVIAGEPKSITSFNNEFSKRSVKVVKKGALNREWAKFLIVKDSFVTSGDIAKEKERIVKENERLNNANLRYTDAAKEVMKQIGPNTDKHVSDSLIVVLNKLQETGGMFTPEAMALDKQNKEMYDQYFKFDLKFSRENPSIVGYSLLVNATTIALQNFKELVPECIDLYNSIYAKKYPKHPYTEQMKDKIMSFTSVKVGGMYIDFTAPDFNGHPMLLSEQIKDKVALIDLWASWCGPCRRSAKSMIPVYETYKGRGFTIVGVARENEFENGVTAAKKDKYTWLNLIELKDAGKIWEKYGVGNGGGGTFLIDKKGIILAIDPTDKEVKAILDKLL